MECLWLTMEAVWASSPQTLPKKQKVSCFLVSYMPLASKRARAKAYARWVYRPRHQRCRSWRRPSYGLAPSRSLLDAWTGQKLLRDRSALLPRACVRRA